MAGVSSRGRKQGCFQPGPARAGAPDSVTMRQIQCSSRAMAAKHTGWVTALGRRAGDG